MRRVCLSSQKSLHEERGGGQHRSDARCDAAASFALHWCRFHGGVRHGGGGCGSHGGGRCVYKDIEGVEPRGTREVHTDDCVRVSHDLLAVSIAALLHSMTSLHSMILVPVLVA